MQYAMLIHLEPDHDALSEDEFKAMLVEYTALRDDPGYIASGELQPIETATTVRVQNGKTLTTDGPFVDTKEALNGYLVYEADDLDAAIELAAQIPAARLGGAIEVRPIMEW
jgi:hypothetical protein